MNNKRIKISDYVKNHEEFEAESNIIYLSGDDLQDFLTDEELQKFKRLNKLYIVHVWLDLEDKDDFDKDETYDVYLSGNESLFLTLYDGEYEVRDILLEMIEEMKKNVEDVIECEKACIINQNDGEPSLYWYEDFKYRRNYRIIEAFGEDYGLKVKIGSVLNKGEWMEVSL